MAINYKCFIFPVFFHFILFFTIINMRWVLIGLLYASVHVIENQFTTPRKYIPGTLGIIVLKKYGKTWDTGLLNLGI